jgi:hypothetical protein
VVNKLYHFLYSGEGDGNAQRNDFKFFHIRASSITFVIHVGWAPHFVGVQALSVCTIVKGLRLVGFRFRALGFRVLGF